MSLLLLKLYFIALICYKITPSASLQTGMLSRLIAEDSLFEGNAASSKTVSSLIQCQLLCLSHSFSSIAGEKTQCRSFNIHYVNSYKIRCQIFETTISGKGKQNLVRFPGSHYYEIVNQSKAGHLEDASVMKPSVSSLIAAGSSDTKNTFSSLSSTVSSMLALPQFETLKKPNNSRTVSLNPSVSSVIAADSSDKVTKNIYVSPFSADSMHNLTPILTLEKADNSGTVLVAPSALSVSTIDSIRNTYSLSSAVSMSTSTTITTLSKIEPSLSTVLTPPPATLSSQTPLITNPTLKPNPLATPVTIQIRKNCLEHFKAGHTQDGIYQIHVPGFVKAVYCDMTTDGGGWTVFQRRFNGNVNFQRSWYDYRYGFGDVWSEHWLGNDYIHSLTKGEKKELRIEATRFATNETSYVVFGDFKIGPENSDYAISRPLTFKSGTRVNTIINPGPFSTDDKDNDAWWGADGSNFSCASFYNSGWWFRGSEGGTENQCFDINLNGVYVTNPTNKTIHGLGIVWKSWTGNQESLQSTKLMFR